MRKCVLLMMSLPALVLWAVDEDVWPADFVEVHARQLALRSPGGDAVASSAEAKTVDARGADTFEYFIGKFHSYNGFTLVFR